MKRLLFRLGLALGLAFWALRALAAGPWVSGFYVGWMAGTVPPAAIDYRSLTHVMMFSVLPRADGTLDASFFGAGSAVAVDVAQRAHAAGRKAVLVVGGAGTGASMRAATAPATMARFVQNLAALVGQYGHDGVDIDWEPIEATDHAAMLDLVARLRAALPPGSVITADVGWLNANFPLGSDEARFYAQLAAAVDQLNVMTYGMADNWGGWWSWHSSALFGAAPNTPSSIESSVNGYLAAGVPAGKLGIGIGFYGSCWNAPVTAPRQSPGASSVVASDNEMSYANIMSRYHSAANYRYDTQAQAPYLSFAAPTGAAGCTFVSYEDETSVAAKGQYVRSRGLGGTIVWQLAEGYRSGTANPNALLAAVGAAFLGSGNAAATTSSLAAAPAASVYGQAVNLVAGVSSSAGVPGGSVSFSDGAAALGAAALGNGSASLSIASLGAGPHALVASYGGSASFAASQSAVLPFTVAAAATATALTSSRNPATVRLRPTFTARVAPVAPGGGVPTGRVTFYDGAAAIGAASLSNGSASFSPSRLSRGTHAITAVYPGSSNHRPSTSPVLNQVMN